MPEGLGPISNRMIKLRAVFPKNMGLQVENAFAGALAIGDLVYVSGVNTTSTDLDTLGMPKVTKADADAAVPANHAQYVVVEAIPQSGFGRVARAATITGLDTSTYGAAGDPAYLSTTAGATTPTRPTTAAANKQRVGYCVVKSASVGKIAYDLQSLPMETLGSNGFEGIAGSNVANVADQAAGAVSSANFGPTRVSLTIPAGATGNVDFTGWPFKTRVRDVLGLKTAAAGGGAGTVQVFNGTTGNAITDAMSIDIADKTRFNAGTLDDAYIDIAAGATVRVTRTRTASTSEACVLTLEYDRVA